MKRIILASTSPRRKEIFSKLKIPFETEAPDYEEDMTLDMPPLKLVEFLSRGKAEAVARNSTDAIIIAADTFVVYKDHRLGKPKTPERAKEMLEMLSGQEHELITGVTIIDTVTGASHTFSETVRVFMDTLSPQTIENYIKSGEPIDRAGSYALQDLGALLISKIEGDFYSAMGLPLKRVAEELRGFGIEVL